MSLLDECITALGDDKSVLSESLKAQIFESFEQRFPINNWGRIDWGKISQKIEVDSSNNLQSIMKEYFSVDDLKQPVYILWDEISLPAMETNLNNTLRVIDDVTAVSFDTWIFCPSVAYVVEFYHEGEITLGLISKSSNKQ